MRKEKKELTVIIPNWNGKKLLKNCLFSLYKQSFKNFEVVVVDNGSTDGSEEWIRTTYPEVTIISFSKNKGFAFAVNKGIAFSQTPYILVLNNDTVLERNCVKVLISEIKRRKKVAAITPKVLLMDSPALIDSAGDYMNTAGQAFHRGFREPKEKYNKKEEVFLVPATALLINRKLFGKIGKFDETFFAYGEDVDWSFRARLQGYKFLYEPEAIVFHKGSVTGKRLSSFLQYLQFRNSMIIVIKNFPIGLFLRRFRFILIPLTVLHAAFYLLKRGYKREVLDSFSFVFKNFRKLLKARREILRKRRIKIDKIDKMMVKKEWRLLKCFQW